MFTDRPNRALSGDVDVALLLAVRVGAKVAAAFLAKRGAPFAVICRVLAEQDKQRASWREVVIANESACVT